MTYRKSKLGILIAGLIISASPLFAVEYEWKDTSGAVKSLADYKGKPVVLHFWATWCPPCRRELPEMDAWSKANSDVEVIVISLDRKIDAAAEFLESEGIGFPALKGDMAKAQRLGVRGLPTTLVIGPDSSIRKIRMGTVRWEDKTDSESILQALRSDS
ncbi:MAG: TlpA disulfide reductase family protein [Mariprofundaceae bacterium]|nr:TlpA disulfide reductase family protein [Mariprofundaceae bacterium]